mmetsp:Transcript_89940/g.169538  ORF Transcript_89940/g.169538 Transcript_89940/m.169538 type:complete len:84 (+) Transcript_89940:3-254(+)
MAYGKISGLKAFWKKKKTIMGLLGNQLIWDKKAHSNNLDGMPLAAHLRFHLKRVTGAGACAYIIVGAPVVYTAEGAAVEYTTG